MSRVYANTTSIPKHANEEGYCTFDPKRQERGMSIIIKQYQACIKLYAYLHCLHNCWGSSIWCWLIPIMSKHQSFGIIWNSAIRQQQDHLLWPMIAKGISRPYGGLTLSTSQHTYGTLIWNALSKKYRYVMIHYQGFDYAHQDLSLWVLFCQAYGRGHNKVIKVGARGFKTHAGVIWRTL